MSKAIEERRFRRVMLSPQVMLTMLQSGTHRLEGIPQGAEFVHLAGIAGENLLCFTIAHESFDPLPEFTITPNLPVTVTPNHDQPKESLYKRKPLI